jgi:hypothetical protein
VSDLPLPLSATLVVGGAAILAVVGLLIVNRYFWTTRAVGENEVAGFLYAVIGWSTVSCSPSSSSSSGSASPPPTRP